MIYEYKCPTCQTTLKVDRSIHAEASTPSCADCSSVMDRVYTPAPISFRGSGFYSTDK